VFYALALALPEHGRPPSRRSASLGIVPLRTIAACVWLRRRWATHDAYGLEIVLLLAPALVVRSR
jgi:hypothetical protein